MPSASIRSKVNGINPIVGASRDDLAVGDVVLVESVNVHTTYSWTLAFKPEGSTAAFSGVVTHASPGTFTVDLEGPYLVRLIADLSLPSETTQYVRLRYKTVLGELKLVAAGEGYGGTIPVPVDIGVTGWSDQQNFNLTTLLALVGRVSASGNVISVDPTPGFGDYTTIQAAINAAVTAGASGINPFVVQVRPGLYTEDLTFAPYVNVIGAPGTPSDAVGFPLILVRGAHHASTPGGPDTIIIAQMTFAYIFASTNATVRKTGAGTVTFFQCSIEQDGISPTQGPALRLLAGTALLVECSVVATSALPDDRAAITQPNQSTLIAERCSIIGPTGLILNSGGDDFTDTILIDTGVTGEGATGFGIVSDATSLLLRGSQVASTNSVSITVHPSAGAFAHDQSVFILKSEVSGQIVFNKTGIVGSTTLSLGSSEYGTITYPGGALTAVAATTKSTSLFYDNTSSGLLAVNVQDAIDEVNTAATLVRTLDDAYNGGVPSSGSGRTIIADQGAVQVLDGPVPSDPPPAGNTDGTLEVLSAVRVGAIGFDEIDIDANPFGSGPMIRLGQRVVPNNIPFGVGTAFVQARSTGNPLYRNYNLRVQTESSEGGGEIGRLIVQGGEGYANGGSTPDASSIYLQAGSAFNVAGEPGSLFLAPGRRQGGVPGSVVLVRPQGSTPATLTAAGVCANPIGVTGSIRFATNMGAVTASLLAGDSRATVVSKLNALSGISAAQAGGIITITTINEGPNAEIYFLSADVGVNAAIGGFDGQVQVDGTYGETVLVRVTAANEISIGVGGAMGQLVYNADTGKLTVPGVIDPTAMVFEEAAAPSTGATEGAVFVSDGSGGQTIGHLYYRAPGDGAITDISTGGGGGSVVAPVRFVFRPGGVPTGNIYTSFPTLYTDFLATPGIKEVVFDASLGAITIPAATYDWTSTKLSDGETLVKSLNISTRLGKTDVTLATGVVFHNLMSAENLHFIGPAGGAAPIQYTDGILHLLRLTNCVISSSAGPALIRVANAGSSLALYTIDTTFDNSGGPVVSVVSTASLAVVYMLGQGQLSTNTFSNDGTGTWSGLQYDTTSSIHTQGGDQPSWTVTSLPGGNRLAQASRVGFDPSGLVHISGGTRDVQLAIAQLDSAIPTLSMQTAYNGGHSIVFAGGGLHEISIAAAMADTAPTTYFNLKDNNASALASLQWFSASTFGIVGADAGAPDGVGLIFKGGSGVGGGAHNGGSITLRPGNGINGGLDGTVLVQDSVGFNQVKLKVTGGEQLSVGTTNLLVYTGTSGILTVPAEVSLPNLARIYQFSGGTFGVVAADGSTPDGNNLLLKAGSGVNAGLHNGGSLLLRPGSGINGGAAGTIQMQDTVGSNQVSFEVTGAQQVSVGTTFKLVYDGTTGDLTVPGKLTVAGLIDPTGLVLTNAGAPGTSGTEGAVFVSDGSAGLTVGHLYYQGPSNAVPADISTGGGGGGSSFGRAIVPPPTAGWTLTGGSQNNGTGPTVTFRDAAHGGDDIKLMYRAIGISTPWSIISRVNCDAMPLFSLGGLMVYHAGSNRWSSNGSRLDKALEVINGTGNAYGSEPVSVAGPGFTLPWRAISCDGINMFYFTSLDGENWNQIFTDTVTNMLGAGNVPDNYGMFANGNGSYDALVTLIGVTITASATP